MDLEENWGRFQDLDIELLSIMVDPLEQLAAEARDYGLTSTVAADEDLSVSKTYDVLGASMHPGVTPGHTFALVNKAGQIIWRRDWGASDTGMMYTDVDELFELVSEWLQKREAG